MSTEVVLPLNGILNYRSVNIPFGVTVTFKRNAANTPVVMLVQADVIIAGSIDIRGKDGALDGPRGVGGPGGYDGGFGGIPSGQPAGASGLGPGAGTGGLTFGTYGGSASFGTAANGPDAGSVYGNSLLMPLIGGSGGGGGPAGSHRGAGGGGGGGAILIACSGAVSVTGKILADGGGSGRGADSFDTGGAGSGGAIKIVASRLTVSGRISVDRAFSGYQPYYSGYGRIRLEGDSFGELVAMNPSVVTFGVPGPLFFAGPPALRFATVGGIAVTASPTGFGDVTVPTATPNPVTMTLATSGVPVGSMVKVSVIPQYGAPISVDSPPTAGSLDSATTSVSLDIPPGHSVLSAQTSFIVVAAVGDALSRFAQGERVEKVTLTSTLGQGGRATLHTATGRPFEIEPALLKLATLLQ